MKVLNLLYIFKSKRYYKTKTKFLPDEFQKVVLNISINNMFFARKILEKKSFLNNFRRSVEKGAKMSGKFKINKLNKNKEKV